MKVYLCGPINGRSDDDCTGWRDYAKKFLPDTLDPMRRDYRGKELEQGIDEMIVKGDKDDILSCDVLLVYYDKPSVGTSMECLFAWEHDIPVLVVDKSDKPISPWLKFHSQKIYKGLDEAINAIIDLERLGMLET